MAASCGPGGPAGDRRFLGSGGLGVGPQKPFQKVGGFAPHAPPTAPLCSLPLPWGDGGGSKINLKISSGLGAGVLRCTSGSKHLPVSRDPRAVQTSKMESGGFPGKLLYRLPGKLPGRLPGRVSWKPSRNASRKASLEPSWKAYRKVCRSAS